jgi:hypothetical protein
METRCPKFFGYYTLLGNPDIALSGFTIADTVAASGAAFSSVDYAWYRASGQTTYAPGATRLKHVSLDRIVTAREASGTAAPIGYCVSNGTFRLDSAPNDGTAVSIYGIVRAPAFAEGNPETYLLGIDPLYHEDLVVALALCYALEGYEGQEERASYYRRLHAETLALFKQNLIRNGGLQLPNDGLDPWSTPTPLRVR